MPTSRTFVADRGDEQLRLDQVILRRLGDVPQLSRTRVQRWIAQELVRVNDHAVRRPSARVTSGDSIAVLTPEASARRHAPVAEYAPLTVLYEDEYLLALDKAPGVVVHPTYKHPSGTLLNAVLGHLERQGSAPVAAFVQRLDKDTSGVLLVAKSPATHSHLQRAMADHRVHKEYLAVVRGRPRPAAGLLRFGLARDEHDRRRVVATADGRPSATRYRTLASRGGLSLVHCELVTGRTHQIRVHLMTAGWPIVGDRTYGVPSERIARQALHAWRLSFQHPVDGAVRQVTAPLPVDMHTLVEGAGMDVRACLTRR
jgi:23S rRNA pseudouridine1911/1915/1917 synthase